MTEKQCGARRLLLAKKSGAAFAAPLVPVASPNWLLAVREVRDVTLVEIAQWRGQSADVCSRDDRDVEPCSTGRSLGISDRGLYGLRTVEPTVQDRSEELLIQI